MRNLYLDEILVEQKSYYTLRRKQTICCDGSSTNSYRGICAAGFITSNNIYSVLSIRRAVSTGTRHSWKHAYGSPFFFTNSKSSILITTQTRKTQNLLLQKTTKRNSKHHSTPNNTSSRKSRKRGACRTKSNKAHPIYMVPAGRHACMQI